jgi:hypothetical protein
MGSALLKAIPGIGTIASAALGLGGSLFGGDKKKTEYTSTKSPQAQALENSINQYYQSMMGKPSPYTPMNSQMFQGANILSNAYGGGPYQHYGMQQFGPNGMQGSPQQGGMPGGMSGMSPGGSQMPQVPQQMGQGGMPPWLAQMAAAKGSGVPRQA